MITFALVPVRSRVLGAKLLASLALSIATLLMAVGIVAAGVLVASPGVDGPWTDVAPLIGQSAVYLLASTTLIVSVGRLGARHGPGQRDRAEDAFRDLSSSPALDEATRSP